MAPRERTLLLTEVDGAEVLPTEGDEIPHKRLPLQIVWKNVILFIIMHILTIYGLFLIPEIKGASLIWAFVTFLLGGWGITMGSHRLWAHRSYKARLPLRLALVFMTCISGQNDIIEWARDHRSHHKFSETDADPHNAKRGVFFAHMGWLLVRKHPDVREKGKKIDLSDLYADPVLVWQRKYFIPLSITLSFLVPTWVAWYFWDEHLINAFLVCSVGRYCVNLHCTWLVNSVAHLWGMKPYDKRINPVDNIIVSFLAVGEGFHNYHHTFPSDYSTSEYGWTFNITTAGLDLLAYFGLVYDRKRMSPEVVQKRKIRTGDGSKSMIIY